MDGLVGDLIELIGLFLDEGIGPEKEARSIGDTFPFCERLALLKLLRLPGDPCARRKKPGDNSPEFLLLMRDEGFSVGTGCEQRAKAQIPVCCLSGRTQE